jgi:hypothetical protein
VYGPGPRRELLQIEPIDADSNVEHRPDAAIRDVTVLNFSSLAEVPSTLSEFDALHPGLNL